MLIKVVTYVGFLISLAPVYGFIGVKNSLFQFKLTI